MSTEQVETVAAFIERLSREETWAPIEGYPGYSVSSFGAVRGPRALLKSSGSNGYRRVCLSRKNVVRSFVVHRLVAVAFLGPAPFPDALVAHNDGNRSNNVVGNLRWASALENQADRVRHSTRCTGSRVFGAKLVETDIPHIRTRLKTGGETLQEIANDFGVSPSTIYLINHGRIWNHV